MSTASHMNELLQRVEDSLDKIRPYLEEDGGNVKVLDITEDMTLRLELIGACSSCPMSPMTMKAGIEEAIKIDLPEILKIEAINIIEPRKSKTKLPKQQSSV